MRRLILVRHAKAVARDEWDEADDRERPLTAKGERQAQKLARWLSQDRIDHIRTSPAARCVATVLPLATETGLVLEEVESYFEASRISVPSEQGTHVICAHGDNIPWLLKQLGIACHECRKGSVWVVDLADQSNEVIASRYLEPPE